MQRLHSNFSEFRQTRRSFPYFSAVGELAAECLSNSQEFNRPRLPQEHFCFLAVSASRPQKFRRRPCKCSHQNGEGIWCGILQTRRSIEVNLKRSELLPHRFRTDRVKEFCLLQEELATAASSALRGFEASRLRGGFVLQC